MMSDDIERISFSAEEIRARVQELGAQITQDYRDAQEKVEGGCRLLHRSCTCH